MGRLSNQAVKTGLPPIAEANARLIILGSLPGDVSLAQRAYYAHATNQFWRLIGGALGEDLAALDYPARLERLRARRIGLWDVIGSASRRGSLDQAIRDAAPNPLAGWIDGLAELRAIAFNGQAASTAGRRMLRGIRPELIDLPSSSAANTMALADKAAAWQAVARFLD